MRGLGGNKSDNPQYNTLGRLADGTIVSLTKGLMFQVCIYSFPISLTISLIAPPPRIFRPSFGPDVVVVISAL